MAIWVDADSCPVAIREILFRAAHRTETNLTLVANQHIKRPVSPFLHMLQVPAGFDVADHEIVKRVSKNDLVITSDIPLAAEVVELGASVLTMRGEELDSNNVRARLNIRDFMDTMRSSGVQTGGPAPLSAQDKQQFANALDRWLQQNKS